MFYIKPYYELKQVSRFDISKSLNILNFKVFFFSTFTEVNNGDTQSPTKVQVWVFASICLAILILNTIYKNSKKSKNKSMNI